MAISASRFEFAVDSAARYRAITRVTLIGSAIDLALALAKLVVGWVAHSQALIADGMHSLSDLATDLVVILAAKHAARGADREHPYGHGRYETLATVSLALVMLGIALGIGYEATMTLLGQGPVATPGLIGLSVAVLSIVSKEWIYRYTMQVAQRLDSNMLRANAWHSRSDAFSSIVVVVGIGGVLLGFPWLDPLAAIVVAGMIGQIAYRLGWRGLQELIDAGLAPERVAAIEKIIRSTDGVVSLHMLRTRSLGHSASLDVHIQVKPRLSVSEGHYIAEHVGRRLKAEVREIEDVTVHTDAEDDAEAYLTAGLPPRAQIITELRRLWDDPAAKAALAHAVLHYLAGRVHIELLLPLALAENPLARQRREQTLRVGFQSLQYAGQIHFAYAPEADVAEASEAARSQDEESSE